MNLNFIEQETAICEYACNRYYIVEYNHDGYNSTVKGFLLNYYNGNIVLLAEDGVYHLKYKDIIFMRPARVFSLDKYPEYREVLKKLQVKEVK